MPRRPIPRLTAMERLNFMLTNRLPRRWLTLLTGWLSRRRHPLVRRSSIALLQFFAGDLRLYEARKRHFDSLQDCFTRELRPGARPLDLNPARLVSPCDGIVGACGSVHGSELFQAKGHPYELGELLGDEALAARYRDGVFVTLRLRANFYHRFHAPAAGRLGTVHYIAGDTWNVNPPALKCVERLYCRNVRAVLPLAIDGLREPLLLVPVAAIAVASLCVHGLRVPLGLRYHGPTRLACDRPVTRGQELGYFRQGSTLIVIGEPALRLADGVCSGSLRRMGEPLLAWPTTPETDAQRPPFRHGTAIIW